MPEHLCVALVIAVFLIAGGVIGYAMAAWSGIDQIPEDKL